MPAGYPAEAVRAKAVARVRFSNDKSGRAGAAVNSTIRERLSRSAGIQPAR